MSSPASNHKASMSVGFERYVRHITMLWTTCQGQPSLSNSEKFFISSCCFKSWNWDLERPSCSFLIVSSTWTQWLIFPLPISSSKINRTNYKKNYTLLVNNLSDIDQSKKHHNKKNDNNTNQVIVAMTTGHCYNDLIYVVQIKPGHCNNDQWSLLKWSQHFSMQISATQTRSLLQWPLVIITMTIGHGYNDLVCVAQIRPMTFLQWTVIIVKITTTFFKEDQRYIDPVIIIMTNGHCYNDLVCVAQIRPWHSYNDQWSLLKWPQHFSRKISATQTRSLLQWPLVIVKMTWFV